MFKAGDGADILDTTGRPGESRIVFVDLPATAAVIRRVDLDGPDVMIAFAATGDQVLVRGALGSANVASIRFADGVELTRADLASAAVAAQASARSDIITGSSGADVLRGGHGDDDIDGGAGFDTADLAGSNVGVRADIEAGIGQGGHAQGDRYIAIEALASTAYADELGGDSGANTLEGRGGNDLLVGRAGVDVLDGGNGDDVLAGGAGSDQLIGGVGMDIADYADSTSAVSISLAAGTAAGGEAEGDVLAGIEGLTGSQYDDLLEGDAGGNRLAGGRGDDILIGGAGDDVLAGGRGADQLAGGDGIDTADYSGSADGVTIDMADGLAGGGDALGDTFSAIERVVASFHDDVIRGDSADNVIVGGRGADVIDGRGGIDSADYSGATEAVAVDLAAGVGTMGEAAGDQLTSIERLVGSEYADQLSGSSADESFDGRFGDDTLAGRGGSDRYRFGYDAGADTIVEADAEGDIDSLVLDVDVERTALSLVRTGDDLLVELEHDDGLLIDTVLVMGHFAGTASGVEEIVFADGTVWGRADIEGILRVGRFNAADDIIRFADEDVELIIASDRLTRNDATEGTEVLAIVAVGNAVSGSVSLRPDGSVAFLGAQDFNGDAFFDYTVRDAFGRLSTARAEVNVRAINDAPIANNDGVLFAVEDTPLFIDIAAILGNDTDIDGDALSLTGVFGPIIGADGQPLFPSDELRGTNGEARVGFLGDLFFVPERNHYGFAGFTYEVRDPSGATAVGTVEIHFAEVNDAPETTQDNLTARLGRTLTITELGLLVNDSDPEGDAFTLVEINSPTGGTATLRTIDEVRNGVVVQSKVVDFDGAALGEAAFDYVVEDVHGARATGHVTIDVIPLNDPPIARRDDGFETVEDVPLVIDPTLLLANDWDLNGDILSIIGVERFALNGTAKLSDDKTQILFTPRSDYIGAAGFTYIISDGRGGTDTAFVSITIVPDNDAPILRDDVISAVEDQPVYVLAAETMANDLDHEGDFIVFEGASVLGVLVADFSIRDPYARTVDLAGPLIAAGSSVTMTLGDGEPLPAWLVFDAATQTITGTPPDGVVDPIDLVLTFSAPDPATGGTVSYADSLRIDPRDATALVAGIVCDPELMAVDFGAGAFSAVLWTGHPLPAWLAFDAATRQLSTTVVAPDADAGVARVWVTYTPDDSAAAPFSIEVRIDPGQDIDPALNRLLAGEPYFAAQGKWVLPTPADASVTAGEANLTALPDWLAFDPATLTLSGLPPQAYVGTVAARIEVGPSASAGTPAYALITGLVVDPTYEIDEIAGITLTVTGEEIAFVPPRDFFGAIAIEYTARDTKGAISSGPATIIINVAPRRGAPDATEDLLTMAEDGRIEIPLTALLSNDRDEDGDPIRIVAVGEVSIGTLEVRTTPIIVELPPIAGLGADATHAAVLADGSALPDWLSIDPVTGRISGTPPLLATGPIDVVVASLDGVNTFITELSIPVDGNADAVLVYVAEPQYAGPVVFSYTLADGEDGTDTSLVRIEIAPLNDPPVAVDDEIAAFEDQVRDIAPAELLANDTDVDGDTLRIVSVANAEHGTVELVDGVVRFTPDHNFDGRASFDYVVTDDANGEATARANVDVQSTNLAPVAVADRFSGFEDTPYRVDPADLLGNDLDPDGDAITLAGMDVETANGRAFLLPDGSYALTPRGDFTGEVAFTYRITDSRLTSQQTGTIVVDFMPVNDAPVVVDEAYATVEDTAISIAFSELLSNDSDVEGDALSVVSVLDPVNGTVMINGGQAVFTPRADCFGNGGFSYVVEDAHGARSSGFVAVSVLPESDLPFAVSDLAGEIGEDTSLVIDPATLLANDFDHDGDAISFVGVSGLGASVQADGSILFTPTADHNGRLEFGYWITDGNGPAVAGIAYVDVRPVNDAPTTDPVADVRVAEDGTVDVVLPAGLARDVDGDPLTMTATRAGGGSLPSWLVFDPVAMRLTGAPPQDFNGHVGLEITASDGGLSATAAFELVVDTINDAPALLLSFSDRFVDEDALFDIPLQQGLFADVDGDALSTAISMADGSALPSWLGVQHQGLRLTGRAPEDFNGTFDLRVTASDGTLSASDVFAFTVNPVNDAPVLERPLPDHTAGTLFTGEPFAITIPADTFSDPDGDPLLFAATLANGDPLPAWLSFNGSALGCVAPDAAVGDFAVRILASDGRLQNSDEFVLRFALGNEAPVASADGPYQTRSPAPVTLTGAEHLANDTDADGDPLAITAVGQAGHGTVTRAANGTITYTPATGFVGNDQFLYTVSDGRRTAQAAVTIEVGAPYEDVQTGGSGSDALVATGRDDAYLAGGGGSDVLVSGRGDDYLSGGTGSDLLSSGGGNDILIGGGGDDLLLAGSGNDDARGSAGDDTILAGSGDDTITGGSGDDVLFGGSGSDIFVFGAGDGADQIFDYETLRSGRFITVAGDRIELSFDGVDSFEQLLGLAQEQGGGVLFDFGNGDELFLRGTQLSALDRNTFTFT